MPKKAYFITEDGALQLWEHTGNIDLTESVMRNLNRNIIIKCSGVFRTSELDPDMWERPVRMAISTSRTVLSVPLQYLTLTTTYEEIDGVFTPAFAASGPPLPLKWYAPDSMRLKLAILLNDFFEVEAQFLVAFDGAGISYRMPLSNTHDDCKLCAGAPVSTEYPKTLLEAGKKVMDQLRNSNWQKDLYNASDAELVQRTRALFRFKSSNEGFQQEPFKGEWTRFCTKVGTEFITNYIIP